MLDFSLFCEVSAICKQPDPVRYISAMIVTLASHTT